MSTDVLREEFEVLESIYPTEVLKRADDQIQIDVEPDDPVDGADELKMVLTVHYLDGYPEVLPELSLEAVKGTVDNDEIAQLLDGLLVVGQGNLGMVMTFTLICHLQEQLSAFIKLKKERQRQAEIEKERLELEAEEARTRGTPVTPETFRVWKAKFDQEQAAEQARREEVAMKELTSKEREEFKRIATRLTGRQLFEGNRHLEDDNLTEEGAVSVDITQYDRSQAKDEEDEQIRFSDSD